MTDEVAAFGLGIGLARTVLVRRDAAGTMTTIGHAPLHADPSDVDGLRDALRRLHPRRADAPDGPVVAALPHRHVGAGASAVRDAVAQVFGAPPQQVIGAPVAAVAWLRHHRGRVPSAIIVCDLDVGGVEVTRCRTASGLVLVHDSAAADVDDDGARLASDLRWRPAVLRRAERDARYREAPLQTDGPPVTAGALLDAFAPYDRTLRELLQRTPAPFGVAPTGATGDANNEDPTGDNATGDDVAVLLIGEVARFPLVHDRLVSMMPARTAVTSDVDPADIAAIGGALVAAGATPLGDRYPHSLSLRTRVVDGGLLRDHELPLIPAGTAVADLATLHCTHPDGAPVQLTVEEPATSAVEVDVRFADGARTRPVPVPQPHDAPRPGHYTVSVQLNRAGTVTLVLDPVGEGTRAIYPLGGLPAEEQA